MLSAKEVQELEDGGEIAAEDILTARMAARAAEERHVSFLAFTATPKAKTLELFGTLPDPARPSGKDNLPRPFHVYSMRQAIEEGFILDVLRNYVSWRMAFRLTHEGQEMDDKEVEAGEAQKRIHGLGAAAPAQHRRSRADRGGALSGERGVPPGRQGQGHGCHCQPQGGRALDAGHARLHRQAELPGGRARRLLGRG